MCAISGCRSLSLPLLPLCDSAQIAVENMRLKREEEEQARELKELEARLQKARTKRQLNEKLKVRHSLMYIVLSTSISILLFLS